MCQEELNEFHLNLIHENFLGASTMQNKLVNYIFTSAYSQLRKVLCDFKEKDSERYIW